MFGGALTSLDPFTRSLLTNRELLEIDQHSSGNKIVYSKDDLHVWTANGPAKGVRYVSIFNFSDAAQTLQLNWDQLGFSGSPERADEIWTGASSSHPPTVETAVPAHGVRVYKVVSRR